MSYIVIYYYNHSIMGKLFVFGREDKDNVGYDQIKITYSMFYYRNMKPEIIKEYKHRYITKNKFPHSYMKDHLLLRPKEIIWHQRIEYFTHLWMPHLLEYAKINKEYKVKGYHVYENPDIYKSVPKLHIHLCECKVLDSIT